MRGELGLFGFVFWGGAEQDIVVTLCGTRGSVGFVFARIGFVLHNTGHDSMAN